MDNPKPVVHYSQQANNNEYHCGADKLPGTRSTTVMDRVDCVHCLRKLIDATSYSHQAISPAKCCGECKNLTLTEDEQIAHYNEYATKPEHICLKFNRQIFHYQPDQPHLLRCHQCIRFDGFERREGDVVFHQLPRTFHCSKCDAQCVVIQESDGMPSDFMPRRCVYSPGDTVIWEERK